MLYEERCPPEPTISHCLDGLMIGSHCFQTTASEPDLTIRQAQLSGDTPGEKAGGPTPKRASLENYRWQSHCHGLFELPIAA
jgi:hypothetical protein